MLGRILWFWRRAHTLDLSWIFEESPRPAHSPEGAERGSAVKDAAQSRAAAES
jgi:hypothetical protein